MTRIRAKSSLEEDEVALGRIVGIFGLQGEVRLLLHNRASTWLQQLRTVFLVSPDGDRFEAEVQSRPGAGGRVIGIIDGVEDREAARSWMEHELVVVRTDLPDLEEGEWYHHDILGASVVTTEDVVLGTVREIHTAGAVDTWLVCDAMKTYYVPNVSDVVVSVDTINRRVVVRFAGVSSED
jgi:16S rRNA processing protein RimM